MPLSLPYPTRPSRIHGKSGDGDSCAMHVQPLEAYLPVALAAVDCGGREKRLIDCPADAEAVPRCTNGTDSTVLACGNTDSGAAPEIVSAAVRGGEQSLWCSGHIIELPPRSMHRTRPNRAGLRRQAVGVVASQLDPGSTDGIVELRPSIRPGRAICSIAPDKAFFCTSSDQTTRRLCTWAALLLSPCLRANGLVNAAMPACIRTYMHVPLHRDCHTTTPQVPPRICPSA